MLEAGDRACVMEVSSHALALHRADAIHFEVALFTNLTQDHLDFHADMEDYFRAKRLLFEMGPGAAIVNVDDPYGRRLAEEFECVTFSAEGADGRLPRPRRRLRRRRRRVHASARDGEVEVRTGLPGHFNVANALGAFAAARGAGGRAARRPPRGWRGRRGCRGGSSRSTRGRRSPSSSTTPTRPDSLENVLRAARRLTEGRVICGLRRRRRPRPRQAAEDGPGRRPSSPTWRSSPPTTRAPRTRRRSSPRSSAGAEGGAERRGRARPPRRDRAGAGAGRAGRHGRDRRQGPRAGPGVRGRPQGPLRRPRGRPRGAAEAGQRRREAAARARSPRRSGPRSSPRASRARRARATIDSGDDRRRRPLLRPARRARDGGEFAAAAIEAGAWGVVVAPERGVAALRRISGRGRRGPGSSPSTTRSRRCRRWPGPGGARSAPASSGSPARSARPRSRTSPGRCCRAGSTPTARTSTPRSGCR